MNFDPRVSVRTRLAFWNVLTLLLILALFGLALRVGVEKVLLSSLDRQLDDQIALRFAPLEMPPNGFHGGPPDFMPGGPRIPGDPPFVGPERPRGPGNWRGPRDGRPFDRRPFERRGPDGRPLRLLPNGRLPSGMLPPRLFPPDSDDMAYFGAALPRARQGRAGWDNTDFQGEPIRVRTVPLLREGQWIATAQAAGSLTPVRQAVSGVTMTVLYLIPLVLLLTGGGALALTNSALKPVRDLTAAADRIEGANLSERLPVRGSDEFAQLAGILNAMLGRIENAFARQKRFTADASHELRTPLAVIKAHTSLLIDDDLATEEELRAGLKTIDAASDRAQRIVQDLLLLARGDNGTLPVRWEPVVLNDVLQDAVGSVRAARTEPTAALEIRTPPAVRLVADRDHLTRLFVNLLENAVRHTPATGTVTITVTERDLHVRVTVTDTGEGIPPEHLARITEPFYRVDAARARKSGGAGLGLAICRTILDALGGDFRFESVVGNGTTVTITLPTRPSS
ncbi:MAG: HAMP domain-containing sensor histidine kinase [Capsulimonadales bacterium]|nr:HAMP domain-containing sensor histidine kinase [Capsulimonadales bacterium]